jgi:proline iminopeptidase
MAAWVRKAFGKDRIFVLGHSWGSFLGLQLAERRPEWLYAYIGVGQLIDGPENERRGWRFAMDAARRASNPEAIRELEAIAPYAVPGRIIPDQGHLRPAQMGRFLRRRDGLPARQPGR